MDYSKINIALNDDIATLTIQRPKALNALNKQVMDELHYFFSKDFKSYPGLKGVIITGSGEKAFVAGADISEFSSLDSSAGSALSKKGQGIFFTIEQMPIPVIALVNGFCLGAGCELAMSCHMRIATPNAKFGQPEVNLGLIPGYGGTQRLIQYIGKSKGIELLLTGDMIRAEEALALGLVNYVLESTEAIAKSNQIIEKIASKGPIAIAKTIECVNSFYNKVSNGFEDEYERFGQCIGSEDAKEGASAFLEKRKANFNGK